MYLILGHKKMKKMVVVVRKRWKKYGRSCSHFHFGGLAGMAVEAITSSS
jgi:hypothetical protein